MKLFIPSIKNALRLNETTKVPVQHERRNDQLLKAIGVPTSNPYHYHAAAGGPTDVVLPLGTVLTVDRIYIRQGKSEYDSLTFRITECPDKRLLRKRFWLKLDDVNGIDVTIVRA